MEEFHRTVHANEGGYATQLLYPNATIFIFAGKTINMFIAL